jgi:hypothetical protein
MRGAPVFVIRGGGLPALRIKCFELNRLPGSQKDYGD